jgi:UDPglucose--hexose-1-phosphate uridylyltransferase
MSELRQDIVSGDWAIIAPGRAKRPDRMIKKKEPRKPSPKSSCPFEDLEKSGNGPILAAYPSAGKFPTGATFGKKWDIAVIPNKYPALAHSDRGCAVEGHHGIYRMETGIGAHELVVTRNHNKTFSDLSPETAAALFKIFQGRYRVLTEDPCHRYISTFFNWGSAAGASVWHPHYQILALPIIPPHIAHSLRDSEAYFKKNKRCVRCDVIKMERKERTRLVGENREAIAFAPYASQRPFEISIFPKRHVAAFAETPDAVIRGVTSLLQKVLGQMKRRLRDPDYNVFIHGAPLDYTRYPYHHWHIEVVPKISTQAGFEFATEVDINVAAPEDAAKILRR